MNIVWKRPDGSVAITMCARDIDPIQEAEKLKARGDIPPDWEMSHLQEKVVKDEYRNAWRVEGNQIKHCLKAAGEIQLRKIREKREEHWKAVDNMFKEAMGSDDPSLMSKWKQSRQRLKDLPDEVRPLLNRCRSVEEIRKISADFLFINNRPCPISVDIGFMEEFAKEEPVYNENGKQEFHKILHGEHKSLVEVVPAMQLVKYIRNTKTGEVTKHPEAPVILPPKSRRK